MNDAPLAVVSAAEREAIARGPRDRATHARLLAALAFAQTLDRGPTPPGAAGAPDPDSLRVLAWNAERCRDVAASTAFLRAQAGDLLLLSELDWGMARSGQRHTARELASQLGLGFAFGVEFLELGLGNEAERARLAGTANDVGYHGNAILARVPLADVRLVRLEQRGDWSTARAGSAAWEGAVRCWRGSPSAAGR